jgi:UDP-N-acetylmuramoyl-tripeptide--D-alanyl-D-alanine ligase
MTDRGMLLLNGDDLMLRTLPQAPQQRITWFGQGADCAVQGMDIRQEGEYLCFRAEAGKLAIPVRMQLEGEHYVNDALAAVAVGLKLAVPSDKISESLASFRNISGRQEIFEKNGYTIINDCYNAGPESMAAALKVLGNRPGRHIAVLADMLELGDCAPAEHYKIGRIAAEKADIVFAYGPNAGRVIDGALTGGIPGNRAKAFDDHGELAATLKRTVRPGDVMLVKGSRGMHMEIALELFLKDET